MIIGVGVGMGCVYVLFFVLCGVWVVVSDVGIVIDGIGIDGGFVECVVEEICVVGGEVVVWIVNLFDDESVCGVVWCVVEVWGCIDILIYNVGIVFSDYFVSEMVECMDWLFGINICVGIIMVCEVWLVMIV